MNGKFITEKCLEDILTIHNISIKQFEQMNFNIQKEFQLELEKAIVPILLKYFPQNAIGKEFDFEIWSHYMEIESYDPNEPEAVDISYDIKNDDLLQDDFAYMDNE